MALNPNIKMNHLPFQNLKVIELAGVLAGPSVGMFFAELGAHVLKIENKLTNGDVTRSWKQANEDNNTSVSAYFSAINYKKEYALIDFHNPTEFGFVIDQMKDADVVIVNFKKGDAEKFKLDFETLNQLNPSLIYGEISGFGEESDRVAYDLILQAETGFMDINGTEESGPVKMPVALIDVLAGHQLKEGILVALMDRIQSGKGCRVHVSLYDSAVASLANQASNWLMTGVLPVRRGSKHPNIAPYGEIFTTADKRQMTLAIGSDGQFKKLCAVLNLESIVSDERFANNQNRVKNRKTLEQILTEKIANFDAESLTSILNEKHVPAAVIRTVEEVFQNENAKKLIRTEKIEGFETKRVSGTVFKLLR